MKLLVRTALFIFFSALLHSSLLFGQTEYQKGYFITNDNQKTECLIRNVDWKNNPTTFDYKTNTEEVKKGSIDQISEFGIYNVSKYVRSTVDIDMSPSRIQELSDSRQPNWQSKTVFLKNNIDGKYSLYSYDEPNMQRFFYAVDNDSIRQLVYKKYTTSTNGLMENNAYWNQLFVDVNCGSKSAEVIKKTNYDLASLIKHFELSNTCAGEEFVSFDKKEKGNNFHLKLTAGANLTTVIANTSNLFYINLTPYNLDDFKFGPETGITLGVETEFILPFNNNKWGLLAGLTYQKLKTTHSKQSLGSESLTATLSYTSLELPVGLRHYFFLNETTSLFINAHMVQTISLKGELSYAQFEYDLKTSTSYSLGGGIAIKKLSAEVRYYFNRPMLHGYQFIIANENRVSLTFGYQIL